MPENEKTLVDTLTVAEDVGGPFPAYKKAIIQFWSDGTVTWVPREHPDPNKYYLERFIGDT